MYDLRPQLKIRKNIWPEARRSVETELGSTQLVYDQARHSIPLLYAFEEVSISMSWANEAGFTKPAFL